MAGLLTFLQYGVSLAFIGLGVLTFRDWIRDRTYQGGYLALAAGLLAAVALLGRINVLTDRRYEVIGDISLVGLMASGYGLLLFRHAFLPLRRSVLRLAGVAGAGATVFLLAVRLPPEGGTPLTALERIAVLTYLLVWSAFVFEPVVRFWRASRGRPAVQRARLRSFSLGYMGIILILLVAGVVAGTEMGLGLQVGLQLVALGSVPLLYAGFVAPRWLRRIWREPDEEAFRYAVRDLLGHADVRVLADRALGWSIRLVGGASGLIRGPDGSILAQQGLPAEESGNLAVTLEGFGSEGVSEREVVVPLRTGTGTGQLVVVAGPFTPFFGTDEVEALERYAGSIAIALDRARLLEEVEASRAAVTAAHAELEEFLRAVSHDLRTPLLSIQGYLKYLEEDVGEALGEDGTRYVDRMRSASGHMGSLIADLLELSRIGRLEAQPAWENLSHVARQIADELSPLAADAGAHISVQEGLPEIRVRPGRLRQLLTNLVANAMKYGRRVPLHIEVGGRRDEDGWTFWVRDDGVGVPPQFADRIFRSFERVDHRSGDGTGMGLAIVRKITDSHGGSVWLDPHSEGACFLFRFPNTREAQVAAGANTAS